MRRLLALAIAAIGCTYLALSPLGWLHADASRPTIVVDLPKDRTKCGQLVLRDSKGKIAAGPFPACGVADATTAAKKGNPDRSVLAPYGDTPTGGYKVTGIFRVGDGTQYPKKSYGDYAAVRLEPVTGLAKLAADMGRTGLLIHGSDLGAGNKLRPTNGCVRMSNSNMKELVSAIVLLKATDGFADRCSAVENPSVTVTEPAPPSGVDDGDPPLAGNDLPLP